MQPHVSIKWFRGSLLPTLERTLLECTDPLRREVGAPHNSVLELTKTGVDASSLSLDESSLSLTSLPTTQNNVRVRVAFGVHNGGEALRRHPKEFVGLGSGLRNVMTPSIQRTSA